MIKKVLCSRMYHDFCTITIDTKFSLNAPYRETESLFAYHHAENHQDDHHQKDRLVQSLRQNGLLGALLSLKQSSRRYAELIPF